MARNIIERYPWICFVISSTFRVNPGYTTPTRFERKLHVALRRMIGNDGEALYKSF